VPIRFFRPRQELADVVTRIYTHEASRIWTGDAPSWLIVPDGEIKLIFPLRGDITCSIGRHERRHCASRLIVSGMRTEPGRLAFPEGVDAIGVILRPEAAYRLFDVPHDEMTNCTLDGEEVFGGAARRWQEELVNLTTLDDRLAALQKRLLERLRRRNRRDATFELAVRSLRYVDGRVRVEDVAQHIGWSRRHLERRFREYVGIRPKTLASVLRFHAAYKRLRCTGPHGYGDAIREAYFDQSHFLKEFKRFTGMTPRVYAGAADYGRLYIPD
jgi:AraC-like DNA-binding protein